MAIYDEYESGRIAGVDPEMSTGKAFLMSVALLAYTAIQPWAGLYAIVVGAAGGFAFGTCVNGTPRQSDVEGPV